MMNSLPCRHRAAFQLLLLATAGLTAACDNPPPWMGVTPNESGEPTILYNPCKENRLVRTVELTTPERPEEPISVGRVIWKIVSTEGSLTREFVPGEDHAGFQTETQLAESLLGKRLSARIDGVTLGSFDLNDLRASEVYSFHRGYRSLDAFWEYNTCRR